MTEDQQDQNHRALVELLATFGRAYFRADREALAACTSSDFEWHQHTGPDAPDGRVLRGVEEVCRAVEQRKATWRVRYGNFETHTSHGSCQTSLITSTFTVEGVDDTGAPVDVRAVDLYRVERDKIARKDSFWKQIQPSRTP